MLESVSTRCGGKGSLVIGTCLAMFLVDRSKHKHLMWLITIKHIRSYALGPMGVQHTEWRRMHTTRNDTALEKCSANDNFSQMHLLITHAMSYGCQKRSAPPTRCSQTLHCWYHCSCSWPTQGGPCTASPPGEPLTAVCSHQLRLQLPAAPLGMLCKHNFHHLQSARNHLPP